MKIYEVSQAYTYSRHRGQEVEDGNCRIIEHNVSKITPHFYFCEESGRRFDKDKFGKKPNPNLFFTPDEALKALRERFDKKVEDVENDYRRAVEEFGEK